MKKHEITAKLMTESVEILVKRAEKSYSMRNSVKNALKMTKNVRKSDKK